MAVILIAHFFILHHPLLVVCLLDNVPYILFFPVGFRFPFVKYLFFQLFSVNKYYITILLYVLLLLIILLLINYINYN